MGYQQTRYYNLLGTVAVLLSSISMAILFRAYAIHGPFTPLTCNLLDYGCPKDIPFRGYVHHDYMAVAEQFKAQFYTGKDVGGGVAAYVDNELVLDIQSGWKDTEKKVPYTDETLQVVFSSTKVLACIVVAQMVAHGHLSYDDKIATHWPEFAQGHKENVTVADLLQHKSGLAFFANPIDSASAEDPDRFSRMLASQPHNFNGLCKRSYHAITQGWYINEVLKRTANTTVDRVAATYMAKYGIEWRLRPYQEVYDSRIAQLHIANRWYLFYKIVSSVGRGGVKKTFLDFMQMIKANDLMKKTLAASLDAADSKRITDLRYRRIENPSNSGFTNARSIAKLAAMMANGGKAVEPNEPDLLDNATYTLATQPEPDVPFDILLNHPVHSLKGGFSIMDTQVVDNVTFVGWYGYGGSVFYWNQEHKIGFGYVTNAILGNQCPDERSLSLLQVLVKLVRSRNIAK